jgi:ribosomal subunit interface protein
MKYNIKTIEFSLTPAINDYVEKKLNSLDKFIHESKKDDAMCYVEIGKTTNHHKNGDLFLAEFTLRLAEGESLHTSIEKEDLYTAIDLTTEELAEELRSKKDKKVSLMRRGGAKIKSMMNGWRE